MLDNPRVQICLFFMALSEDTQRDYKPVIRRLLYMQHGVYRYLGFREYWRDIHVLVCTDIWDLGNTGEIYMY